MSKYLIVAKIVPDEHCAYDVVMPNIYHSFKEADKNLQIFNEWLDLKKEIGKHNHVMLLQHMLHMPQGLHTRFGIILSDSKEFKLMELTECANVRQK